MSSVRDVDRGAKALLKRVKARQPTLRVGVFGDKAAHRAIGGKGVTVGDLATAHEFTIPGGHGRSFIRAYVEENQSRIAEMMRRAGAQVAAGKLTAEQALNLVGFQIVGEIQQRMARGIPPALSANYLPRKLAKYPGATTPLIASGQLRSSITHAVDSGGA